MTLSQNDFSSKRMFSGCHVGLKLQHFRLENTITADSSLVAQQKQTILSLVMYISCSSSKKISIMRDHCFQSKLKMATSAGSSSYWTAESDIRAVPKPIPIRFRVHSSKGRRRGYRVTSISDRTQNMSNSTRNTQRPLTIKM
jgi:hypothetical protein